MGSDNKHTKLYLNTAEMLELRERDYPAFINKLYEAITEDPTLSIGDDTRDDEYKAAAIDVLLRYYEKDDEFERCQALYEIQKRIKRDGKK